MSRRSGDCGIISRMGIMDVKSTVAEIEATTDMLERALKLSGLVTTMFQQRGSSLVVVGGSTGLATKMKE